MASSQDGLIANDEGEVVAYWASFLTQTMKGGHLQDSQYFAGITADTIDDMLGPLRRGEEPAPLHALGAEMEPMGLAAVRGMLLDSETTEEVEARCKHWPPQVMCVRRRWAGSDAWHMLRDSDVVLEIDGSPVETFRDIEVAVAQQPQVSLLVVRGGKKLQVQVKTKPLVSSFTDRVVLWCGALLQAPPAAIAAQRGQEQRGVYVASRFHGSPAATYHLPPMSRIIEVDGLPTPDLDAFLRVAVTKKDGESVRIKRLDLREAQQMTCMRVDTKYWPVTECRRFSGPASPGGREPCHWRRSYVTHDAATDGLAHQDFTPHAEVVVAAA